MPLHRQVFFIGGFDPKSPRYYHRLFREAAAHRPAAADSPRVVVGPRESVSSCLDQWTVQWRGDAGPDLETRYHVLRWDDIVRRHWARNLGQSLRDHVRVYLVGGRQGVFGRVRRLAPAAFWLSLVPLGLSLGTLLATAAVAGLLVHAGVAGALVAALALPAWLLLWRGLESRIDSEWLLRLYGFTEAQAGGRLPELEQRLDEWTGSLLEAVRDRPCDEIMVVGHSTGCMLAVALLDRVLRRCPDLVRPPQQLALLTLGHCMPILAGLDSAGAFRASLSRVADQPGLSWLDVSSPADWAAFAQVGPWLGEGRALRRQVSPRFHRTMSEAGYARLLADRQALHLHYLRPQERDGGYDVVALTVAAPLLAERLQAESPWSV